MKKTKELELFEALVADPNETGKVKVSLLDKRLLKMADEFKKKNLENSSNQPKKSSLHSNFLGD